MRLAANTGCRLHLIEPLGFDLDDKRLRRAGLDYREFSNVTLYPDWQQFKQHCAGARVFGITTKGSRHYHEIQFQETDYVVMGPETRGLPASVRGDIGTDNLLRIPMLPASRSLNLSNATAVVVYEAWRQNGFADAS